MNSLAQMPAFRRLDTDNDQVFAVEIEGHATSADAENLFGLLEGAYALHDRIDVLIRASDFDGADWPDIAPETIAEGRRHAEEHVRRCAVVGGPDWTGRVGGFFAPAVPIELRYFTADAEPEAWRWLGAKEIPADV